MRVMSLRSLPIALLLSVLVVGAQPAGAASTPAARHGAARVVYVALGASDTVGVGSANPARDNWTAQLARRLPAASRYVNLGRSGSTLSQALTTELPAALRARPTLVTVWLAVNDLNALVTPDDYGTQLDRLLSALQKTHARVYVGNVPDLSLVPIYKSLGISASDLNGIVRLYNGVIATTCARHGATVVDLYAASKPVLRNLTNVGADGFHPSTRGYTLLANLFYQVMRRDGAI
jgi:acyl-CoA thioesterase-1